VIAVPFGPLLAWKRGDFSALRSGDRRRHRALIASRCYGRGPARRQRLAPLAIGLAVLYIAGALSDLPSAPVCFRLPFGPRCSARAGLPRSTWGTVFAHAGVGMALIGIVCETTWNSEYIESMKPDDVAKIAGYELKLMA